MANVHFGETSERVSSVENEVWGVAARRENSSVFKIGVPLRMFDFDPIYLPFVLAHMFANSRLSLMFPLGRHLIEVHINGQVIRAKGSFASRSSSASLGAVVARRPPRCNADVPLKRGPNEA